MMMESQFILKSQNRVENLLEDATAAVQITNLRS